jgi:ubiquinone biosynthesis protein UbiJ
MGRENEINGTLTLMDILTERISHKRTLCLVIRQKRLEKKGTLNLLARLCQLAGSLHHILQLDSKLA